MNKSTKLKLKLILLAVLPVLLIGAWLWLNALRTQQALAVGAQLAPTQVQVLTPSEEDISGKPATIIVPSQNINLPVADGIYDSKSGGWTLSNDKAQFALISVNANNHTGNTFIYGHNSAKIFQRLADVKPGDTAEVITDNGYLFTYKYRRSIDVTPRDTDIFRYQGPAILTLQTCSGLWDQTRQLLTFDFVKVDKI
jgi:LPXTG-site transpeptidase (sortase) family protein